MKVGFYIENKSHQGIDYSMPEKGNPGIGGTQFMFWTVAWYLKKIYVDLEVYILAPLIETMPDSLYSISCNNSVEAVRVASSKNIDILILRGLNSDKKLFEEIEVHKQKVVFWSHNHEDNKFASLATDSQYVYKNVCVGKEQLDRLRDHKIYCKSTYIYNALDFSCYYGYEKDVTKKIVGYMGSLTPKKGFHRLAKNWKKVLKHVPDAELYVLGGGNLYNRQCTSIGDTNISDEKYYKKIIKYLDDGTGKVISSVKFMGIVAGNEKSEVLKKMSVGVVNPIGRETFCISAVEFEYFKIPVVTVKKNGVLDTVVNGKTGLLFNRDKDFVKYIVRLLNDHQLNEELGNNGYNYVLDNFEIKNICLKWRKLFDEIMNGINENPNHTTEHWLNDFKLLREANRKIKCVPLLRNIPSLLFYKQILRDMIKYLMKRKNENEHKKKYIPK
ncbi:MAG: glycosyltransferase family 4 protein [Eubacteriales bacterium]